MPTNCASQLHHQNRSSLELPVLLAIERDLRPEMDRSGSGTACTRRICRRMNKK